MLSEKEKEIFNRTKEYALKEIEPISFYYETHPKETRNLLKKLQKDGYCGINLPRRLGGKDYTYKQTALVYEALSYGSPIIAFYLQLHNNITLMIEKLNDTENIQKIVRKMILAECTSCFCLTEETSGSDPASTKAYCVESEDGFHVYGHKKWIANLMYADYYIVMLKTFNSKEMKILLIDSKFPRITVEKMDKIIVGEMLGTGKIYFDDVVIPKDMLLSIDGFRESLAAIDVARIFVPAICVGLAQRSIDIVIKYLSERESMGKFILASEGIQWKLAEMSAKVEAARQLVYHTAESKDNGEKINILGAENKLFATDVAMEVTTNCLQLMGANGLYEESPISRNFKIAKMFNIIDGTGEILKYIIGRSIYRSNKKE